MTDIQFRNSLDSRNRHDILIMQTMPCIDFQTVADTLFHAFVYPLQFMLRRRCIECIGITPGMQFNNGSPRLMRGYDLFLFGIDEKTDPDAGIGQPLNGRLDDIEITDDIQSAFRRQFLPALGNQTDILRPDFARRNRSFPK